LIILPTALDRRSIAAADSAVVLLPAAHERILG
jgi:hypothetical protein